MKNQILNIIFNLQKTVEASFTNDPTGACYLLGHCLNEVLKKSGFNSRKVTGKHALLLKSGSNKYVKYGTSKLKGILVGNYHTWCEVDIDGITYIVDPTLKYNLNFLKEKKIIVDKNIEGNLISKTPNTYYYKYVEEASLEEKSESFLDRVDERKITSIIDETISRINLDLIKMSV